MPFYRAVPKQGFNKDHVHEPQLTRRIPSNIPYLVDNIWEWLRPVKAPSRRQAVYASPTPELALANASAVGHNPDDYIVCELDIFRTTDYRVAHLKVTDARQHADIGKLSRLVVSRLGKAFSDMPVAQKMAHAPLFLPAVSASELHAYFHSTVQALELSKEIVELSTFWQDAEFWPQDHNGELFLEFPQHSHYYLRPLA